MSATRAASVQCDLAGPYDKVKPSFVLRFHALRQCEKALWAQLDLWQFAQWVPHVIPRWQIYGHADLAHIQLRWADHDMTCTLWRGFVEEVSCDLMDWAAYGPAIVRSQPILRVDVRHVPSGQRESTLWNSLFSAPIQWARGPHFARNLYSMPPLTAPRA